MIVFISGFLTGLSVGIYCLGSCLPIFIPILLGQKRDVKKSFWLVLQFSFGRLLGYIFFGFMAGFLGLLIRSQLVHHLIGFSTFLLGLLMIGYSLGLVRWGAKVCGRNFLWVKVPFLLGFLTGVGPCPPFLASLGYVFNLKSILLGMGYFLFFFLGTSVYIVPLAFLGFFTRKTIFQKIARASGVLVGIYFLISGLRVLLLF
ncbi:sulfite exporter TauE/SafE family protein [Candidatus Microgenomates bacterium]|nr:sulfite exporter TauE/SafE family protein [Candidatus Microgenomates bacterium]